MESYRSLLECYVERYNAGDLDGVMDLYAEDSVQLMPDGTFEGRSVIHDRLAKELAAFSDIAHRYVSYVEEGDAFADEWVFVGTHTGLLVLPDGTELPPTGKRVEVNVTLCFVPLLGWIVNLWSSTQIALTLDATSLGEKFVVLAICVFQRKSFPSCALGIS